MNAGTPYRRSHGAHTEAKHNQAGRTIETNMSPGIRQRLAQAKLIAQNIMRGSHCYPVPVPVNRRTAVKRRNDGLRLLEITLAARPRRVPWRALARIFRDCGRRWLGIGRREKIRKGRRGTPWNLDDLQCSIGVHPHSIGASRGFALGGLTRCGRALPDSHQGRTRDTGEELHHAGRVAAPERLASVSAHQGPPRGGGGGGVGCGEWRSQ